MKTILLIGRDRIAWSALEKLDSMNDLLVVIDRSNNFKRMIRLISKKRLSITTILKMLLCELRRIKPYKPLINSTSVKNNSDLLKVINKFEPDRVVLFRAGLLINPAVISTGIPLLNIHCANVPQYGGLGAIQRALSDRKIIQNATLHRVTEKIDDGEIFDLEPYELDLKKSYCYNEDVAYEAGIRLLLKTLKDRNVSIN